MTLIGQALLQGSPWTSYLGISLWLPFRELFSYSRSFVTSRLEFPLVIRSRALYWQPYSIIRVTLLAVADGVLCLLWQQTEQCNNTFSAARERAMKCHRADRVERAPDPLFIVLCGSLPHPHAPAGKAVLDLSNLSGVWFYLVFSESSKSSIIRNRVQTNSGGVRFRWASTWYQPLVTWERPWIFPLPFHCQIQ